MLTLCLIWFCLWSCFRVAKKFDSNGAIQSTAQNGVKAMLLRWLK
jgi:hypothetical protein